VTEPTLGDLDPEDRDAARFARASLAAGDPTGWFDRLYSAAATDGATVPWDRHAPNPTLVDWAAAHFGGEPQTGRAMVVGCGYGDDAEHIASLGFDTTAFDLSAVVLDEARARHQQSSVHYRAADLFELPTEWEQAFDLVVEIFTVQTMPTALHPVAIDAVASLVAPGGTLLVVAHIADGAPQSPPWPLTRDEIDSFPLSAESVETISDGTRWLAVFRRPA
jgi:SAM-dependent methyltransferase